ncbi:hypothetical protein P7K49_023413 [Saguinus oedipus]|uniref:Uncharacterized protein n=1 Tax=Saguinus oedipus TaxID=9490 RepID=A0ABQ9ULJ2_SAGOE|nr:hypothetical protein P7K49_023413 [Saguinus oedipus]
MPLRTPTKVKQNMLTDLSHFTVLTENFIILLPSELFPTIQELIKENRKHDKDIKETIDRKKPSPRKEALFFASASLGKLQQQHRNSRPYRESQALSDTGMKICVLHKNTNWKPTNTIVPEGDLRTVPALHVRQDQGPMEEYGFCCAVLVYFLQELLHLGMRR